MSGIPVKPTSRQEIWTFVRGIRRALGVENDLYFDIIWFIERILPEVFSGFILEICPQEEMGELHGKTVPSENKICIREDVYIGACHGNGRDRLTLAHEIGHFFMHDEGSGGELLAPSYLIDGMSSNEIHKSCAVSLACADSQLRAVEREKIKNSKSA